MLKRDGRWLDYKLIIYCFTVRFVIMLFNIIFYNNNSIKIILTLENLEKALNFEILILIALNADIEILVFLRN